MRRAVVTLLVLSCGAAWAEDPADPEAPSVRVLAKKDGQVVVSPKVKVGEPFQVVVTAVSQPDVVVNLPASFDLGSFEVLERKELPRATGSPERSFELTIVAWEPGAQALPPIPVTYVSKGKVKQVATGGLAVDVVAVVHEAKDPLRPIAGPVSVFERNRGAITIGAALAAMAILLGLYLWLERRARRRRVQQGPAPAVVDRRPPDVIALEKLARLAQSGALDAADRRLFYFELTEIVREFLGRRFGFDALDMTTSELLGALRKAPGAEVILGDLEGWLLGCDLVKYAGVQAGRSEAQGALEAARGLVERARPIAPPAADAGAAPAQAEAGRA